MRIIGEPNSTVFLLSNKIKIPHLSMPKTLTVRSAEARQVKKIGGGLFLLLEASLCIFLLVSSVFASEIPIETIAREASGESFEAQVWVASVIKTRMSERKQTAEQVCLAKWQFSCWNEGARQKARTAEELQVAGMAWAQAQANGANLYHDCSVMPKWAKSPKVKFIRKIGRLLFYKEARG